jgi:iturin family lipopeptide synthetase A
MNEFATELPRNGIAIVGLAGRFPGAPTVKDFWRNLTAGVESIQFASPDELSAAGVDPALSSHPDYVPASGRLHQPEYFDAPFFGFSAREAEIIDPQQRVFLECAWEALEDAACDANSYPGVIGVFAGAGMNTYAILNLFHNLEIVQSVGPYQIMLGNEKDFLCSRVAYKLNLRGPAIGVQTACSTSLVAVQMAFESLLRRECDVALAGGVSIAIPQPSGYLHVPGMIHSRDGHCRAFDAAASGTVASSGAGVAVLKRLQDAIADGDHIYAVIQGAAVDNDGSSKAGYSAPSIEGQTKVIRKSMQMAQFDPATVGYVEAHGTGTEVGDPIEVTALSQAFGPTAKPRSCVLSSAKTNIGHLDTAAGIASLIKAALSVKHRVIPPTLHFSKPNPLIDLDKTPFRVSASLETYDAPGPFRAGVSSFGIGGTNAHVSIEEAPALSSDPSTPWQLIVLSAKTGTALDAQAAQLLNYLDENPAANLADVAFTLQKGRQAFQYRRVLVARDVSHLRESLQPTHSLSPANQALSSSSVPAEPAGAVFLFPGQGAQYVNMGIDLYRAAPVFRDAVDTCCEILKAHMDRDLKEILYPSPDKESEAESLLQQTCFTQPALFVIEYAMARLFLDCGIRPTAMLGHSIGEYVAACLAGVFSLQDALALVAARGKLIHALPPGAMLAVNLSESDMLPLLSPETAVAAINAPSQTVASGAATAIAALEVRLRKLNIEHRRLRTSHAFHSPMMDAVVQEFNQRVAKVKLNPPTIPYLSNVTGTWITAAQATDPAYWGAHIRKTVRFTNCVQTLLQSDSALLEMGPGETLVSLVRQHLKPRSTRPLIPSMRSHHARQDDREVWLTAIGRLWLLHSRPDWNGLYRNQHRLRLSLPTYPFERQRYWIEPKPTEVVAQANPQISSSIKKADVADWFYVPSWRSSLPQFSKSPGLAAQTWLLFADDEPFAEMLAAQLGSHGKLIRVRAGGKFLQLAPDLYHVDPASPEDHIALLRHLHASGNAPTRVVRAWLPLQNGETDLQAALDRTVLSSLYLAQAIEQCEPGKRTEFSVLSDRAYSIFGEQISSPLATALNAMLKVISLECPGIACRVIDCNLAADSDAVVHHCLAELLSAPSDAVIAYRGSARWIQYFDPVRFEKPQPGQSNVHSIPLRQGGTYIITGGLGGVGLVLAQHLARTVKACVILTSRTTLPPASEWNAYIESTETSEDLKRRIQGVQSIEQLGGKPIVVTADTIDSEAMARLVATVRAQYGPVRGIVHAAGLAGIGLIQGKSRDQALAVLSPKIQGAKWIRECLAAADLDFVLLCSSISAVLPSFGVADYAAANAHLDGFANAYDDPRGTRVLSVNWDTWRDVGMAAQMQLPAALAHFRDDNLKHAITSEEATDVFDRVLFSPVSQVLVSTSDFAGRQRKAAEQVADLSSVLTATAARTAINIHSRTTLPEDFAAPVDEIQQFIVDVWQELLGVEPIGIHDDFFQLGGHSLLGTQVLARLREHYKVTLSLRVIFDAPTPAQLAQHVQPTSWTVIPDSVPSVSAPIEVNIQESSSSEVLSPRAATTQQRSKPLAPADRSGKIPQTHAQQGLWLIDHFDPGHIGYNIPAGFLVDVPIDLAALQSAVNQLLSRHEILRTSFYEEEGELFQAVASWVPAPVEFTDLSSVSKLDRDQTLRTLISDEAQKPFDLLQSPLVRFHLFRLEENRNAVFFSIHHIIADRKSLIILCDELNLLYQAAAQKQTANLPPLPIQYADYAIWMTQHLADEPIQQQFQYWKGKLAGIPPYLELNGGRPYPETRTPWAATTPVRIPGSLRDALNNIAQQEGATLFMTLMTALAVLLYQRTHSEDFCIGSPITYRKQVETEPLIGMFVNMLAFRCKLEGKPSFRQLLQRVRTTALEAYENSDIPFQELVRVLNPDPRSARPPFFQVMFGFDSDMTEQPDNLLPIDTKPGMARFDLTLELREHVDGILGSFEYSTDLFDQPTVARLADDLVAVLEAATAEPDLPIAELGMSNLAVEAVTAVDSPSQNGTKSWRKKIQELADRLSH